MKIFGKRALLVCLFLVLVVGSLVADSKTLLTSEDITGYAIERYEFDVDGKTTGFALKSVIVPSEGDPVWESEEAFIKALDEKRQKLINKQLFLSVEYTYSFSSFSAGVAYYTVTFTIEDSNTLLVLPYPKFDNDETGFLFGIKAKNTNLMGTLGELVFTGYVSQNDGTLESWDDREDLIAIDIDDLSLWESDISITLEYLRQKQSLPEGELDFDITWSEVKLFHDVKLSMSTWGDLNPSEMNEFNYEIGISGLNILGTTIGLTTWGNFNPTPGFGTMNPEAYGFTWVYGPFYQNGGRYTLSNTIEHNYVNPDPSEEEAEDDEFFAPTLNNVYTNTVLTYHDVTFLAHPFSFNMGVETNKLDSVTNLNNVTLSSTLGTLFNLPFGLTWDSSVKAVAEYYEAVDPLSYHFEYTNILSNDGSIDYVSHKMRKGLLFSLMHVHHQYPQEEYEENSYWYLENSITWFPFIFWRINPSIRVNGFYAEHTKLEFLPSTESEEDVSEYFRGYLSRSSSSAMEHAEGAIPWGIILNMNLTIDFIDFGFAKSYATPFLDVGIFGDPDAPEGYVKMASAGLEGWGVLDRFPSHPIRVALGFNLFDVLDAVVHKTIGIRDVEWELSIGFELYF
ncbi:MAG: hypothetical protein AB7D92_00790 [Sphaerochaeta sp.]